MQLRSYLKWVGNKASLFPLLMSRFPKLYGEYYEPFVGSGSVFLGMSKEASCDIFIKPHRSYLRDINIHLINCHIIVGHRLSDLIKALYVFQDYGNSTKHYQKERLLTKNKPLLCDNVEAAARVIYLNRRAYGGMWRENKSGIFNVPQCDTQIASLVSSKFQSHLKECSIYLRQAIITHGDYSDITPQKGDFVFLDPPYYPISESSNFTNYSQETWTKEKHNKFFEFVRRLDNNGVLFMMTNNNVKEVRDKFKRYNLESIQVKRFIDSLKTKNGVNKVTRDNVEEVIIRNY